MTFDPSRPETPQPGASGSPAPFTPATPEPAASMPTGVAPVSPVQTTATATKGKGSGRLVNVALAIAVAIAIGGVAFAAGRGTAPAAASTGRNGFGNFPRGSGAPDAGGQGGLGGRGGFGGPTISGTVESVSADSVTVTTASGQTIQVSLGSDTTYDTKTPATASDVTTGSKVEVRVSFAGGGGFGFGNGNGNGGAAPSGPIGTASNVTVVP